MEATYKDFRGYHFTPSLDGIYKRCKRERDDSETLRSCHGSNFALAFNMNNCPDCGAGLYPVRATGGYCQECKCKGKEGKFCPNCGEKIPTWVTVKNIDAMEYKHKLDKAAKVKKNRREYIKNLAIIFGLALFIALWISVAIHHEIILKFLNKHFGE